jgi:general secretion pathway protein F
MMTFRYRALTPNGEVVSGSISANTAVEVAERVEYLGLIPIETVRDEGGTGGLSWNFTLLSLPRPEDVTIFTGDLGRPNQ